MKFSGVITIDKIDVCAKGQHQRSKVNVIDVKKKGPNMGIFQLQFEDGYKIMPEGWSSMEEVP